MFPRLIRSPPFYDILPLTISPCKHQHHHHTINTITSTPYPLTNNRVLMVRVVSLTTSLLRVCNSRNGSVGPIAYPRRPHVKSTKMHTPIISIPYLSIGIQYTQSIHPFYPSYQPPALSNRLIKTTLPTRPALLTFYLFIF